MRRKDREIIELDKIINIIDECDIIRLGLSDGDFPYIVPVNFAYTVTDGQIRFYIHGAVAGRKYRLLKAKPLCSFEMDIPLEIVCMEDKGSITMRYKSVMGKAKANFLEGDEKRLAMENIIMARYAKTKGFDYNRETLARTAVIELEVIEISAKANNAGFK